MKTSPAGSSLRVYWRLFFFTALCALAFAAIAAPGAGATRAQTGPTVTASPARGTQNDVFVFTGTGFAPGEALKETYTDPSGAQYAFVDANGQEFVIQADSDGNWEVSIHPRTDFAGACAGTWLVSFCSLDTDVCYSGTIEIAE